MLLLVALVLVTLGLYLWIRLSYIGIFEAGFMILGSFQFILCLCSHFSSRKILACYVWTMTGLLVIQVLGVGLCFLFNEKISEEIAKQHKGPEWEKFKKEYMEYRKQAFIAAAIAGVVQVWKGRKKNKG